MNSNSFIKKKKKKPTHGEFKLQYCEVGEKCPCQSFWHTELASELDLDMQWLIYHKTRSCLLHSGLFYLFLSNTAEVEHITFRHLDGNYIYSHKGNYQNRIWNIGADRMCCYIAITKQLCQTLMVSSKRNPVRENLKVLSSNVEKWRTVDYNVLVKIPILFMHCFPFLV